MDNALQQWKFINQPALSKNSWINKHFWNNDYSLKNSCFSKFTQVSRHNYSDLLKFVQIRIFVCKKSKIRRVQTTYQSVDTGGEASASECFGAKTARFHYCHHFENDYNNNGYNLVQIFNDNDSRNQIFLEVSEWMQFRWNLATV